MQESRHFKTTVRILKQYKKLESFLQPVAFQLLIGYIVLQSVASLAGGT